jgi:release factor glutamine methyltransferase
MSASACDPTLSTAAITERLRAAGCVFAEEEAQLLADAAETPEALRAMVDRRATGLPIEQVVGWAEFCGMRIALEPGVFVPRRRSEFLVRLASARAAPGSVVVDLACGSGAIGAAIAARAASAGAPVELHACDIDPSAVRCARRNLGADDGLRAAGGRVYAGDLYEPLPAALRGQVSVITANVPYVPTEAVVLMPAEARMHEPLLALDGGPDGLDVLRRAARGAGSWLVPAGHLLIETSRAQAAAAADAFTDAGLAAEIAIDEDLGATVIIGRHPA